MEFKSRSLDELGRMIVGDAKWFRPRSRYYISQLFEDAGLPHRHDGQTKFIWAAQQVKDMVENSANGPNQLPSDLIALFRALMVIEDSQEGDDDRQHALAALNVPLKREGFEAFYDDSGELHFKHLGTQTISAKPNPHRPFTPAEVARRDQLSAFLDVCSEDELIEDVLVPLLRQLQYHQVTSVGHEDKNLEHGKDVWMRYQLPSQHMLYFGLQVKKGKLDASADSVKRDGPNTGVAIIHHQILMMLDSVIFDPEFNSRRLVDHAYIVTGGKITKSAQKWLGDNLAASQRSRIMFMGRDEILNLFIASNMPMPQKAIPAPPVNTFPWDDELDDVPF